VTGGIDVAVDACDHDVGCRFERLSSVGVPSATRWPFVDDAHPVGELVGLFEVLRW